MVTERRMIARRIAIAYVVLGAAYFLLWHFVLSPAGYADPFLEFLFYISLPAILASPYVVCELASEAIKAGGETSEEMGDYPY